MTASTVFLLAVAVVVCVILAGLYVVPPVRAWWWRRKLIRLVNKVERLIPAVTPSIPRIVGVKRHILPWTAKLWRSGDYYFVHSICRHEYCLLTGKPEMRLI